MKRQATGKREHGTESLVMLLRNSIRAIGDHAEPARDLWPAMQQRLHQQSQASAFKLVPWFDWALAAGLLAVGVLFPVSIPVLLYYL